MYLGLLSIWNDTSIQNANMAINRYHYATPRVISDAHLIWTHMVDAEEISRFALSKCRSLCFTPLIIKIFLCVGPRPHAGSLTRICLGIESALEPLIKFQLIVVSLYFLKDGPYIFKILHPPVAYIDIQYKSVILCCLFQRTISFRLSVRNEAQKLHIGLLC